MKPFLHVHRDGLPILPIASVFQGVRIDCEPGMSQSDIKALVNHYQHDNLLEVKCVVHDVDTALYVHSQWPAMDIQFLIEPNLTAMDWSPREDYLARINYLYLKGVKVCGPSFSNIKETDLGLVPWTKFKKICVHGYGYQPEELPALVSRLKNYSRKDAYIGEYTADPTLWDDKERASYHARAIKASPIPLVIYRAQHQEDGPGYFEMVKGEWNPRPALDILKKLLAVPVVA